MSDIHSAWAKIRPLLSSIPANLKAEIALIDSHLQRLESKAAPLEHIAESFVEKVEKVISKVKGS